MFRTLTRILERYYYLQAGKQTKITSNIAKVSTSINGSSNHKIQLILDYVKSLRYASFNIELFRKRTADQIIKDNFVTGCTDSCLIFVALCRACEIPAKYVETIDISWLENGDSNSISGHQYSQVWIGREKRWIWVDPFGNRIDTLSPENEGRVIYKIGLDSWSIGISDMKSLKEKFDVFRRYWLKNMM